MGDPKDEQKASAKAGKRLRLSVVDFNASFGAAAGSSLGVDTGLLDEFQKTRIDDYTLVNTIFFKSAQGGDAAAPDWAGFAPLGQSSETARVDYLRALIKEMHARGQQVIVSYTLDEGQNPPTPKGGAFNAWLAAASAAQLKTHAQQIVDFFTASPRKLEIDGIDFDLEIQGLGRDKRHKDNLKTLYVETASAIASARPGASVSYDNATFTGVDGGNPGTLSWFAAQPYAHATGAPNLLARPMHDLNAPANKQGIKDSIDLALKVPGFTPSKLQIMFNFFRTGDADTIDIAKTVLAPAQVGLVLYNMGTRSATKGSLQTFAAQCVKFDAALNPAAAGPNNVGAPLQAPLTRKLP